jgi:hypothetical protein
VLWMMRDDNSHQTNEGRVAYRVLVQAALRQFQTLSTHEKRRMCDLLGMSRQAVWDWVNSLKDTVNLDAKRKLRSDALDQAERDVVLRCWEVLTRPSPNMKDRVRFRGALPPLVCTTLHHWPDPISHGCDTTRAVDVNEYISHGTQFQEDTGAHLYAQACKLYDLDPEKVSLSMFKQLKPYFVKPSKWNHSLCPCALQFLLYSSLATIDCVPITYRH